MLNIDANVNGNTLILKIDLTKRHGLSKSGKTTIVASSQGNQPVDGHPDIKFGLNVYT
jgi:hypothetical protein